MLHRDSQAAAAKPRPSSHGPEPTLRGRAVPVLAQAKISGETADKDCLHIVEVFVGWHTRWIWVQSAAISLRRVKSAKVDSYGLGKGRAPLCKLSSRPDLPSLRFTILRANDSMPTLDSGDTLCIPRAGVGLPMRSCRRSSEFRSSTWAAR